MAGWKDRAQRDAAIIREFCQLFDDDPAQGPPAAHELLVEDDRIPEVRATFALLLVAALREGRPPPIVRRVWQDGERVYIETWPRGRGYDA